MNYKEHELSEYLDDLLVKANIEIPRTKYPVTSADEYADDIVNFKMAPRVQVTYGLTTENKKQDCLVVKYKNETCDFSLVDGSPLTKNIPDTIKNIIPCVQKLLSEQRDKIISGYRETLDLSSWKHTYKKYKNKKNEDDGPVCDGLFVEQGHILGERKRPWLENAKKR